MPGIRLDLSDHVALVTGGGSGIGAGIAKAMAAAGATVALAGRRLDRLDAVRRSIEGAGGHAIALPFDLARGEHANELVTAAVERLGRVDDLVHAAGNHIRRPALEITLEDFDTVVGVHLRAAFSLAQSVGRHLREVQRPGSITFVGSLTSERLGIENSLAYASAKSGLLGLMRTLAVEWARYHIRVNAVIVGFVATEMTREVDDLPARRALTGRAPLGRLGTPEEVGGVAAFLASGLASYINGASVTVDGGWSIA